MMTSGTLVQLFFDANYDLGQEARYPKEVIFGKQKLPIGRSDIYKIFQADRLNPHELPGEPSLTREQVRDIQTKLNKLWDQCFQEKFLFADSRGIGVNLAAKLTKEQTELFKQIAKPLELFYDEDELVSGKGLMFLLIDLIELFGSDEEGPSILYLSFEQGCLDGSSLLTSSLEDACLAVESEVASTVDKINQLTKTIWQRAMVEGLIVMENFLVTIIKLRLEVSRELEEICDELIDLLEE